jgi:hypothetical protein
MSEPIFEGVDDLEHDGEAPDAAPPEYDPAQVTPPTHRPGDDRRRVTDVPTNSTSASRRDRREELGLDPDDAWCVADNPAIWTGGDI